MVRKYERNGDMINHNKYTWFVLCFSDTMMSLNIIDS